MADFISRVLSKAGDQSCCLTNEFIPLLLGCLTLESIRAGVLPAQMVSVIRPELLKDSH